MFDQFIHRWLKVPYTLHVRYKQRPKGAKVTVLFLHGIGTSGESWSDVIEKLPNDVRVITIDLLGFGDSAKPTWAVYSAKTQARSVLATIVKLRLTGPIIVVGHSLGSLIAIELSRKYPVPIRRLILCSPPLYKNGRKHWWPTSDIILKRMYKAAQDHPDQFLRMAEFSHKYKLVPGTFDLKRTDMDVYMAALGSSIINQTSLEDAKALKVPTLIIKGKLDPFVVGSNINRLPKSNPNIEVKTILAGHDIVGRFVPTVVKAIDESLLSFDKNVAKTTDK